MDFDFADMAAVDTLDKVPEQFRTLYSETPEKKYKLKADDPAVKGAVEAILGLNTALKAARLEAKEKGKKEKVDLTPLKDYGATPEEIKAKIDELQEKLATNAKVDVKKIKDELALQFKTDIEKKDQRITALVGTLNSHLIDSALKGAIAAEKGDVELLLPFAQKRMLPVEADGKYSVAVVDESGNMRYSGVTGLPMTPAELVKEMKANAKYGKLFESTVASGSGARPGAGARAVNGEVREKSSVEKIAAGLAAMAR